MRHEVIKIFGDYLESVKGRVRPEEERMKGMIKTLPTQAQRDELMLDIKNRAEQLKKK